jgi:hypothetical protein
MIHAATRIDPGAPDAQRAVLHVKDLAREHYQILPYSIPVEGGKLASLSCKLNGHQPALTLFGITDEHAWVRESLRLSCLDTRRKDGSQSRRRPELPFRSSIRIFNLGTADEPY